MLHVTYTINVELCARNQLKLISHNISLSSPYHLEAKMAHHKAGRMFKLAILGDGGVGKTALTVRMCLNLFVETYDPTIEDSYRKRIEIDGQQATLEVLDTAGLEEYSSLRDQWILDGDGFILIYSTTERSSFTRIESYYREIMRIKDDEPFSAILIGNKIDESDKRQVSHAEGQKLAKSLNIPFFETSAKLNINVESAFFMAARLTRDTRNR